jgi:hypothetical protein
MDEERYAKAVPLSRTMSTSDRQNVPVSTSSPSTEIPCAASPSDWLANSLLTARMIIAAAECAPFPDVKGVFGVVVVLPETVEVCSVDILQNFQSNLNLVSQKVNKNRDSLKELCENITEIIGTVRDGIATHDDTSALKFKGLCESYKGQIPTCLQVF